MGLVHLPDHDVVFGDVLAIPNDHVDCLFELRSVGSDFIFGAEFQLKLFDGLRL